MDATTSDDKQGALQRRGKEQHAKVVLGGQKQVLMSKGDPCSIP